MSIYYFWVNLFCVGIDGVKLDNLGFDVGS